MSHKPPPMFRPLESLRIGATPRMLRWLGLLLLTVLIPTGANTLLKPGQLPVGPTPLPVPSLEATTDARGWSIIHVVSGTIPNPGPNQKRKGDCRSERSEEEINGGCWVQTKKAPPCPEGYQWEHDGKCWLPVAHAKPVPQSGDVYPVNVAGDE